jgi:hypothetical protein
VGPRARSRSELPFASLLVYSPDGESEASRASAHAVTEIKNGRPSHIARIGLRFAEAVARGQFAQFLGPAVFLVPAPRSAPFKSRDAAWPARLVCDVLAAHGLCAGVLNLLVRHTSVKKSALLRKGADRPGPDQHEATLRIDDVALPPTPQITIVDDVVTRGATLLGCARVLASRLPQTEVRALAVVRTMSKKEVATMLEPVEGRIWMRDGQPRREP